MAITLTDRERAVLAHVVIDPDAWLAHAETEADKPGARFTARSALDAKVAVWADRYDAAVAAQGEAYQTRAQREGLQ